MGAVATIEPVGISTDVRRMEKQFALALPEHVSPERFVRVVVTAIQSNPDLQKADRESVLGAALKCAQDGLLPDGREAALVVYGGKAAYLPMIAGILTKVRRSGELLTIAAHVVHEKDAFTYTLGDQEFIEHKPFMEGPRGKPIAVYAVAKTKDGGVYREVMSIEDVNQVRNVSRAKNGGPWVTWWGEMARKTVLRRLSKRLPMSTDLVQVFSRDDDHYDLGRQAEGRAKLARLHADFDDPAEVATEALIDPPADDGLPVRDDTPAPEIEAEVQDTAPPLKTGAQVLAEQQASADQGPPGAEKAPADGPAEEGAGFAPAEKPDSLTWAAEFNADLESMTAAEINAALKDPKNVGLFTALDDEHKGAAKSLNDAINARLKALKGGARG
jgi:recombination protein RecT